MPFITGSDVQEIRLESTLLEMESLLFPHENIIYSGKSLIVGQNKHGFQTVVDLHSPSLYSDLSNFFFSAKENGDEKNLEALREIMRTLKGEDLKLFEDSLNAVVKSYHITFGNFTRQVSERIGGYEKKRIITPYDAIMPIVADSFDRFQYVCQRLSRIKDKELINRIEVSVKGFILEKHPSPDPEKSEEDAQKIMKITDIVEKYGPKELREKLHESISMMEKRRAGLLDLPEEHQQIQELISITKPNKWKRCGLESKLSSPLEEQKFQDELGKHCFYELFENHGVIISSKGEVYLENPSSDFKYRKEIDGGGAMTPVALAMNMDGVLYDKKAALKAIEKMKSALNEVEFEDYVPLSTIFTPQSQSDKKTDRLYKKILALERAIMENQIPEAPYFDDPKIANKAFMQHRKRLEGKVIENIEAQIERNILDYHINSRKSFLGLKTDYSLGEEDAKHFIQTIYSPMGMWIRQLDLNDYQTFKKAIDNLTSRSSVSDFFNNLGYNDSSVTQAQRKEKLKALMSAIDKHEETQSKKNIGKLVLPIALGTAATMIGGYLLMQNGGNIKLPSLKLPLGLSVGLTDNATDTVKFPEGGIRWPQAVNVTAYINNIPTKDNPIGNRADRISAELSLPPGYHVTTSHLVFANGTSIEPNSISSDKIVYQTGPLNPGSGIKISSLLQSTLDSRTGNYSIDVTGNYNGQTSTTHASKKILVPLGDLYYPILKEISETDPNWARYIAVNNLRMESGKVGSDDIEYWKHPNVTNAEKMINKDFAALSANATYSWIPSELRRFPEFRIDNSTVEAVEDIKTLALNASNTEVRQAFGIIQKNGTPDPLVFSYPVPNRNTQLEVLYWLALQNEFKKNDTLALADAMDHGIFVTMGNNEVGGYGQAVYKDSNKLLDFGRETSRLQKTLGFPFTLEDSPLIGKIAWAWRANDLGRFGHIRYEPFWGDSNTASMKPLNLHPFVENLRNRINLKDYYWQTVSVETLKDMRDYQFKQKIDLSSPSRITLSSTSFAYNNLIHVGKHPSEEAFIEIDGERTINHNINNANSSWTSLMKTGKYHGVSDDAMTLIDALLKAAGIPTVPLDYSWTRTGIETGHEVVLFYDGSKWKTNEYLGWDGPPTLDVYVFRIPVTSYNYFRPIKDRFNPNNQLIDMYHKIIGIDGHVANAQFLDKGISTTDIEDWIVNG